LPDGCVQFASLYAGKTGPLKTTVKRLFTEFMNQLLEIGGNLAIDKRKIKDASKGMSDGWLV